MTAWMNYHGPSGKLGGKLIDERLFSKGSLMLDAPGSLGGNKILNKHGIRDTASAREDADTCFCTKENPSR